jgi:hypothetical protein
MLKPLNVIQNNRIWSWSFAITTGVLFYYGYQLARAALRPLIQLIPAEFYYDPVMGELTGKVFFINLIETSLASTVIAIVIAFVLFYIFNKKASIYVLASVATYLLLSLIRLMSQPIYVEADWVTLIRLIRPVIAGAIFFIVVWLVCKSKVKNR